MKSTESGFLRNIAHACRNAVYVVGVFSFFINLLMLTTAIYMLQVYDRVLASRSYDTLIYLTLAAIVALMALALLDAARARVLVQVSYWLDNALSPAALEKSPDEMIKGHSYGPQSIRDIGTIRQFVAGSGIFTLFDAMWVPIYLVAILYLSPWLFLLATLGAIALFALAILNEIITRRLLTEANIKAITAQGYIDASLRNAEAIQAMGMMPNIIQHWESKNSDVLHAQTIASNRSSAVLAFSKFMRMALQILMLGVGAYLVIDNRLTGGGMIAGTILLGRALAPVEQAIGVWKQWLASRQAYHRLQRHFNIPSRQQTEIKLPVPKGNLILDKVHYRPQQKDALILSNLSMRINPGEMVALIGPSGAGKSTLARLIVGAIQATSGEIRLDGVDVYAWERTDFGKHVGYLPQDVELFPGTIKDNIARMGKIDDEAIIAAAKQADVHDLILRLPQGYDTKIGGQSYVLSGGQRQRIALARAFYQSPKFIVLDEPNANLDQEGEESLLQSLLQLQSQNVTQIIISHKSALIKHVNRIIFMLDGTIKLDGPRDQVLADIQRVAKQVKQP